MVLKLTQPHGFNAKIGFEKYAPSPEILAKMCQILLVWFGRPILDTFLVISWHSVLIFRNRFLRWNRESELVNLNTMNPMIGTTFFLLIKGSALSSWPFQIQFRASDLNFVFCVQGTVAQGDFGPRRFWSKEAFTSDELAQIILFFHIYDTYWFIKWKEKKYLNNH